MALTTGDRSTKYKNHFVCLNLGMARRPIAASVRTRGGGGRASRGDVERWAEGNAVRHFTRQYCALPTTAKSTISISFSPNGKQFASTHGDHTVKVIAFCDGKVLHKLVGHPRTPWTVKFHPRDPNIVASGCLAFQVRIWDVEREACIFLETLTKHIVSLAFHPIGHMLAISSCGNMQNQLFLWQYGVARPTKVLDAEHMLRCVEFSPSGRFLITGEANATRPNPQPRRDRTQGRAQEITVRLKRWDFDTEGARALRGNLRDRLRRFFAPIAAFDGDVDRIAADHEADRSGETTVALIERIEAQWGEERTRAGGRGGERLDPLVPNGADLHFLSVERGATIAQRAVLYNDGGFHVSSDERFLTVCLYDDEVLGSGEEVDIMDRMDRCGGGAAGGETEMDISSAGLLSSLTGGAGAGGPPALSRGALPRHRRLQPPVPPADRVPLGESAQALAAGEEEDGFRLALVSLAGPSCGALRSTTRVPRGNAKEITSVKFSPLCDFILVGYQRRSRQAAMPVPGRGA